MLRRHERGSPDDGGRRHPIPLASITKTVVATVVMRLAEQGKISLDRPVRNYVPDLRLRDPRSTDALTTAHLLTHTGGFQGDVADGAFGVPCGSGDDALARFVELVAHLPQHAPPGRVWAYSNTGFSLAGRVVGRVSGRAFEAACRELVLEPLGMRRSFFASAESVGAPGAVGHQARDGRPQVARGWSLARMLYPAGGLVCPVGDLLRYARFHLGDGRTLEGERLLSPASMALMRAPVLGGALHNGCLASFADDMGLGWLRPCAVRRHLRFAGPGEEDIDVVVKGFRLTLSGWGDAMMYAPDHLVALEGAWRHERGQFLRDGDGRIEFLRMAGVLARRLG